MDKSSHFGEFCHRVDMNVSLTWRQTHTHKHITLQIFLAPTVMLAKRVALLELQADNRLKISITYASEVRTADCQDKS